MDNYSALRSLPPLVVLSALGVDISKFKKRSNKDEWSGSCPIHGSQNNKGCFSIHLDGRFSCFSCSAKGRGSLDLVMQVRKIGFKQACEFLEGLNVPPTPPAPVLEAPIASGEALKPLEKDTWRKFAVPCPWLEQRVPDIHIRERYGVYMYDNPARRSAYSGRVMIPVRDIEGHLFGYLGRSVPGTDQDPQTCNDTPKYLFPKNLPKSHFLFGAHELAQFPLPVKYVYLVESPFAVMHFASLGLHAVSPFGWSVSDEQVQLLSSLCKGIVYLPDRNKAEQSVLQLPKLSACIWVRFPPLPENCQDPETLTLEQIQALTR